MTASTATAVFDCVVLMQALISRRGPAYACKGLVDNGRIALFVSPEVLTEVREVLNRPSLRKKNRELTPERVEAYVRDIEAKAVLLSGMPHVFTYPRDPDDEPYVNLAVAANARYLVTRDNDLLDLMREDFPEGKDFRQRFPELTILDPVALLKLFPTA